MSIRIDLHLHTSRHSACSSIPAERLIRQAVRAGLDGLVITEHHYQWPEDELATLLDEANTPGFILLSGFEYASRQGDILVYGLPAAAAADFTPGLPPKDVVDQVHARGGFCVAAHPTRAGMGFDEELVTLPFDAIEVHSVNMREHEQRLAVMLAERANRPAVASSDAHAIQDVGRYSMEFTGIVQSMADLHASLKNGTFRLINQQKTRTQRS